MTQSKTVLVAVLGHSYYVKRGSSIVCAMLAALITLSSCSGQREFQETARVTLGQTTEYEHQINLKAEAENAYARNMINILQSSARRDAYDSEQTIVNNSRDTFAAQVSKSGGNTKSADLRDFGIKLIATVGDDRTTSESLEKTYATSVPASLAKIDTETSALSPVVTDLTELQSDQSSSDQVKTWITFGAEVKDKYQSGGTKTK